MIINVRGEKFGVVVYDRYTRRKHWLGKYATRAEAEAAEAAAHEATYDDRRRQRPAKP